MRKTSKINKVSYIGSVRKTTTDEALVELPLAITFKSQSKELTDEQQIITMRTPGDDKALIIGLMVSQGIIRYLNDIVAIADLNDNQCCITLKKECFNNLSVLNSNFTYNSSCGLCGNRAVNTIDELKEREINGKEHWLNVNDVYQLMAHLSDNQKLQPLVGGVHGVALFDEQLSFLVLKEDIGRHNAFDKVVGHIWQSELNNRLYGKPLIAVMSSRVSFEMMQKAVAAGICVVVAAGAPSDLAIKIAQRFDITLIGFVRDSSFNVYHGDWRLV